MQPEVREAKALALANRLGSETSIEAAVRDAFGKPHRDVVLWYWRWDLCFPERKALVEIQGCYWHGCHKCNWRKPACLQKIQQNDRAKAAYARKRGWQVVWLWEHDLPRVLRNPQLWVELYLRPAWYTIPQA
jgi:G:T-mismatch repair DNA endonuclease (very short patch repair protein)